MSIPDAVPNHPNTDSSAYTRIINPQRQSIAKWGWIILFTATVVYFVANFLILLQIRMELCQAEPCNTLQVTADEYEPFEEIGVSVALRVLFLPIMEFTVWVICALLALYIFVQRPDDWIALITSLLLVMVIGTLNSIRFALSSRFPELVPLGALFGFVSTTWAYFFLCCFPDGRIIPRWLGIVLLPVWLSVFFHEWALQSTSNRFSIISPMLIMSLAGVVAQIYRYRRWSTPIQRQQTKWVVLGIAIAIFTRVLFIAVGVMVYDTATGQIDPYIYFPIITFGLAGMMVIPFTIAFSVLRFRLWDIDLTINRSLVYGSVTTLLVLVFGGIVTVAAAVTDGQGT